MGWDRVATGAFGTAAARSRQHDLRCREAGAAPLRRRRDLAAERPRLVAYPGTRPDRTHRRVDLRRSLAPALRDRRRRAPALGLERERLVATQLRSGQKGRAAQA